MAGFGTKMKARHDAMPYADDESVGDEEEAPAVARAPAKPSNGAAPGGERRASAPGGNPDQASYEMFVKNGARLIYDEKATEQILKSLDGAGNPVEGLANTLASVVMRLVDSAEKKGAQLSPDVILHGTGELIEVLADFSKESGGHAYTDPEMLQVAKAVVQATQGGEQPSGPPGGAQPQDAAAAGAPPPRRGLGMPMQAA